MKWEWLQNPPQTYLDKKKVEQLAMGSAARMKAEKRTKVLIETCGMRFFIKYYRQVKRLPLRDVMIEESYSSAERDERLTAAKTIIE